MAARSVVVAVYPDDVAVVEADVDVDLDRAVAEGDLPDELPRLAVDVGFVQAATDSPGGFADRRGQAYPSFTRLVRLVRAPGGLAPQDVAPVASPPSPKSQVVVTADQTSKGSAAIAI